MTARHLSILVATLLALAIPARGIGAAEPSTRGFIALCYHNVEDDDPDQRFDGVTTEKLVAQLSWLQRNGYHPVSVDDLLAARDGGRALPDKAVLLTFDDGYESFYTRVFPILTAFRFPAVLALVGAWMEPGGDTAIDYAGDRANSTPRRGLSVRFGDISVTRAQFLSWNQVREMAASGLVEIASHSYDAHRGVPADPQGNSEPDVTTRRFNPKTGTYESDAQERRDLGADSARMERTIERETGKRPRVMVWPYGAYNELAISVAAAHGMAITLTLDDGAATIDRLSATPRHYVNRDPSLGELVTQLRDFAEIPPIRAIHVDLDGVYDSDPARQEENVGRLVQRVYEMQINTVFLKAFADPDRTGLARQVYFPNRLLPMRADLFNRVSWQLQTRAHVRVFAALPLLAFDFGDAKGLSPSDPEARAKVLTVYEDLARAAPFDGLLFGDAPSPADGADLLEFTRALAATARRTVTPLATARRVAAAAVLDRAGADLDRVLATYDYAVVMAPPTDPDSDAGLRRLVAAVATRPEGLKHAVFDLPAADVPTEAIGRQMRLLSRLGALNFGTQSDDFLADHPDAGRLHRDFSLQTYPHLK